MYCIRMKFHVNFDPGGKSSLPLVLVLLIMSNLQFSEVHCSGSTDIGDERWQLRQEFPGTRRAIHGYMDSAALRPSGSSSKTIYGQTNHRKEEVLRFKPDVYTQEQSEQHAIKSLSETFRNLFNKSETKDPAADIPPHKNEFIDKIRRTKIFRNEVKELSLGSRDEKLEALSRKKPSSIHEGDIKKQDRLSWSHQSSGSVVNARSNEHKRLVKRDTDPNGPGNIAEKGTLSSEKPPSTNPQVDPEIYVPTTASSVDNQTSIGTPPPPPPQQSTSNLQSSTFIAQTTFQKPTISSSILSTVQQHLSRSTQKSSLTAQQQPTTQSQTTSSERASLTVHQLPNHTNSEKVPVQSPTLLIHLEETEESPTTDRVEESDAACDGAQCYASRLPYHWTADATWALASMVFLMSILTFFVLYTGLWKKRNPMGYPLESGQPSNPNTKINIAELLKTRLASIPRHLRSKRQVHRKRMNGRRYEELPLHQSNGSCNGEERDYFEDEDEEDLYLRDEHTV